MASTVQPSEWVSKLQGWAYWLKRHKAITLAVALSVDLRMDLKIECCKVSRSHRFTLFHYLHNCLESVLLVCLKHNFCPLIALHHLLRIAYFFGLIYWRPRYLLPWFCYLHVLGIVLTIEWFAITCVVCLQNFIVHPSPSPVREPALNLSCVPSLSSMSSFASISDYTWRQESVHHAPWPTLSKEACEAANMRQQESRAAYTTSMNQLASEIKQKIFNITTEHKKLYDAVQATLNLGLGPFSKGKHAKANAWHAFLWKKGQVERKVGGIGSKPFIE